MKRVAVHNLGCKVNGYELDVMVQTLREAGYEVVPFDEKADVYVINTCTVTNIADRKSRQMLHRAKHQNPSAIVVAVGCYVETDEQRVEADPCVDLAIGNNRKGKIAEILSAYLGERENAGQGSTRQRQGSGRETAAGSHAPAADAGGTRGLPENGSNAHERKTLGGQTMEDISGRSGQPEFESMRLRAPEHTRAYIKIQDGCNQFCSYCIIPYARGRIRSRDTDEIVNEIIALAAEGVQEVVLTGIHISSFGLDKGLDPETELLQLLTRIQMIRGIRRIRLGSLEPRIMTEHFIASIAGLSKVCPHFHLSLQSGCDATLRRMNRHYTAEEFYHSVELLRACLDRPAITTDVIVGFAGETPEEFAQSQAFLEKVNFYEIHVFKYSVRHGTAAARMPGQISPQVKNERSDILLDLTARQSLAYRRQFLGQQEELLLEEPVTVGGSRYWTGHTMRYVQGLVPMRDDRNLAGQMVRGTFTAVSADPHYLLMN